MSLHAQRWLSVARHVRHGLYFVQDEQMAGIDPALVEIILAGTEYRREDRIPEVRCYIL